MSNKTSSVLKFYNSTKSAKIQKNYAELARRGIAKTGPKPKVVEQEFCKCFTCRILGNNRPKLTKQKDCGVLDLYGEQPKAWLTDQCTTEVLTELGILDEYFQHMELARRNLK